MHSKMSVHPDETRTYAADFQMSLEYSGLLIVWSGGSGSPGLIGSIAARQSTEEFTPRGMPIRTSLVSGAELDTKPISISLDPVSKFTLV